MSKTVEIKLGGAMRRLAIDMNAQIGFHRLTGRDIFEMGATLARPDTPFVERIDILRTVLWGMAITSHPHFESDPTTVAQVGTWFTFKDIPEILQKIRPLIDECYEDIAQLAPKDFPEQLAPFVPSPEPVVKAMIEVAEIKPGMHCVDLGAGDGRVMIAAVEAAENVTVTGYELHDGRYAGIAATIAAHPAAARLQVLKSDIKLAAIGGADVVFMYLMPDANALLKPRLLAEMKPGALVVTHDFDFADWDPDSAGRVSCEDRVHRVYAYRIPAPA